MKTLSLQAILSIMILSCMTTITAQNFQFSKKKYHITKENKTVVQNSFSPSQDSLWSYTDVEVIKLVNYIKKLEKEKLPVNILQPNEVAEITNKAITKNQQGNQYTDDELIKLVNYVKYLENLDFSNSIAIVATEQK